jgi:hypothetical protein
MEVIEQAHRWLPYAHYIYIAIPHRKKGIPNFVERVLNQFGIGLIEVAGIYTHITIRAKFNRPVRKLKWDKILLPEHQTWAEGGSTGADIVTPYKLTVRRVQAMLKASPNHWFSMNSILEKCDTHYANPKPSLSKALREFEYEWCETKKERGKLLYKYRTPERKN